ADVEQTLIAHGAGIHIGSQHGFTPLLCAARSGDVECARILLAAGANVDEGMPVKSASKDQPPAVVTPLLIASASGHEALSIFLVEHGTNPKSWDEGAAPLHYA